MHIFEQCIYEQIVQAVFFFLGFVYIGAAVGTLIAQTWTSHSDTYKRESTERKTDFICLFITLTQTKQGKGNKQDN